MNSKIIFEDNDFIILYKPAGFPTQSAKIGQADCVSEIRNYTKGNYTGLVHRLDQPVEGLLVFAKSKKAAAELSRQVAERNVNKYYYAAVDGIVKENRSLRHFMVKESQPSMAKIVPEGTLGAKEAELSYEVLHTDSEEQYSILRVCLKTGRFHQIRCQLAEMGMPILGDNKYGTEKSKEKSRRLQVKMPALCAYLLQLKHPISRKELEFHCVPQHAIFQAVKEITNE